MTTIRFIAGVRSLTVTLFAFGTADAAVLSVSVMDQTGKPVAGMVVAAQPLQKPAEKRGEKPHAAATAVMDQLNQQFVPYVLPVRTGTQVVFPNSDATAHQVYSFSPAKRFELGLYRGQQHAPVLFDQPGIAVLGCNIHDSMVGYVYVTDAPHFGMTSDTGEWRAASVPPGEYLVHIWSPRLAKQEGVPEHQVAVADDRPGTVTFRLEQPLRAVPAPKPRERRVRDY